MPPRRTRPLKPSEEALLQQLAADGISTALPAPMRALFESLMLDLVNAEPSSAISGATYDPTNSTATFHFHRGPPPVTHQLSIGAWRNYVAAGSKGEHYNQFIRGKT